MRAFPVLLGQQAIQYLLRDEFTTDRAAGAVNGTPAEPGPGSNRALTDTASGVSISGGNIRLSGYTNNFDPRVNYPLPIARARGVLLKYSITPPGTNISWTTGFANSLGGSPKTGINFNNSGNISHFESSASGSRTIATYTAATTHEALIALRTSGHQSFLKIGDNWLLLWSGSVDSDATLYVSLGKNTNAVGVGVWDYVRVANSGFLAVPLISDGFGSAFGTSDGLGHAETSGIGSGGSGAVWTQQIGTWGISSGKAVATALSGGEAVATVPLSTANPFIGIDLTRSAGNVGGVARWTDANNHLRFYHDGTNCVLQQVVSGTPTTLITAAATYSANARVWLWLNDTTARLYYNNALVGSTSSINAGLTATNAGIRTTDSGNQLDNFVCYASGVEGQYSNLNQY